MPLAFFHVSSLRPAGLTSMMLWGLTSDLTQIYKLITMQTLSQVGYKTLAPYFLPEILWTSREWNCETVFLYGCVCICVWECVYLMGTSRNFDVIDKRSCSPNPNGTVPYDPLCKDFQRIKVAEFCPGQ